MIRNFALLLAGAVIGVLAFIGIGRTLHSPFKARVLDAIFSIRMRPTEPGVGSPVRVVGGSIRIKAAGQNPIASQTSEVDIPVSDDTTFELEEPQVVSSGTAWTIWEYVNNGTSQGVKISGTVGSGKIIFTLIDGGSSGDTFAPPSASDTGFIAKYKKGASCSGAACEQITGIALQVGGGSMIPYSCPAGQNGVCHISIGNE
jgi:hypothetical protein